MSSLETWESIWMDSTSDATFELFEPWESLTFDSITFRFPKQNKNVFKKKIEISKMK